MVDAAGDSDQVLAQQCLGVGVDIQYGDRQYPSYPTQKEFWTTVWLVVAGCGWLWLVVAGLKLRPVDGGCYNEACHAKHSDSPFCDDIVATMCFFSHLAFEKTAAVSNKSMSRRSRDSLRINGGARPVLPAQMV